MNTMNANTAVRSWLVFSAVFFVTFTAAPACADDELTVDQIVANTNRVSYYQGADGRAQVSMTIVDDQGRERKREMTILRRDEPDKAGAAEPGKDGVAAEPARDAAADSFCGNQKFYVYFHRPADVNKMAFMVWKNLDKDDDRWLYLPALDLVKRISSADKRTSFVGSHFLLRGRFRPPH